MHSAGRVINQRVRGRGMNARTVESGERGTSMNEVRV
jgi:hypothetical protein